MRILYKLWSKLLNELSIIRVDYFPFFIQIHTEGYKVRAEQTVKVMKELKKGDILVRGYSHYLGSIIIGKWSHVGIAVANDTIIHAIGKGVRYEHIIDFCRCDRLAILRPNLTEQEIDLVVRQAETMLNLPYDYFFQFDDNHALSCTELMFKSFKQFKEKLSIKCKDTLMFGCTVKPQDMFDYPGLTTILKFDEELK